MLPSYHPHQECGGINEALWHLASLTGKAEHRATASLFDKPCLLGPLAQGQDALTGMHGNTALALMLGAQRRFEVTGETHFHALTQRFVDLVVSRRSYATGGSTHNELWEAPGHLGHTLGAHGGMRHEHAESCTTHNMVRLVGMLLRASGGALTYADFIERALLNGVLGTQRGTEPGAMLYFMPLGTGVSKRKPQSWRHTGWSTPHGDFWCCQGTGIEAFARLAEHVFMTSTRLPADPSHNPPAAPELFVLQLIPATLQWRATGLTLELEAELPLRADIALVQAYKADRWGNLIYRKAARNFGPVMAMAADLTVVQVREIVPLGEMDPEAIVTPSIFVDRVVHIDNDREWDI